MVSEDLTRRGKRPFRGKYKVRDIVCSIGSLLPGIMYPGEIPIATLEYTGSSKLRGAKEVFYKLTESTTIYLYKRKKLCY
jgi:hypothetical protein